MTLSDSFWRTLSLFWFAFLFCALSLQIQFYNKRDFDTDLSSLTPVVELDDARIAAHRRLSDSVDRRLVIMVGFPNKDEHNISRYLSQIQNHWKAPDDFYPSTWHSLQIDSQLQRFRSEAAEQMTISDQRWMAQADEKEYLARAFNHFLTIGKVPTSAFANDPLGTFEAWVTKRQYHHPIEPADGHWKLYTDDYIWAVMIFQSDRESLRKPSLALYENLSKLRQVAHQLHPDSKVLIQGQPYQEADMAHSIQQDMKVLYFGLFIFIAWLTWFFFKNTKAVLIVIGSMLLSVLCASSLTMGIVGHLHYAVFFIGSLIAAVTASWTSSFFIIVSQHDFSDIHRMQQYLAKRLGLSLLPLLVGSIFLLLFNHPVVEQMGYMFAFGLIVAYFNCIVCLPLFIHSRIRPAKKLFNLVNLVKSMPKLTMVTLQINPPVYLTGFLLLGAFISVGISQLDDQQTQQHSTYPSLRVQKEERQVADLLQLPSSNQYFLIRGNTPEQLLMNEEAFRHSLVYHDQPELKVTCITKWYPSNARRESIHAFNMRAYNSIHDELVTRLQIDIPAPEPLTQRPEFLSWIHSSEATPVSNLFLKLPQGYGSIVEIAGLKEDTLPTLQLINEQQPSATFIDFEADYIDMVQLNRSLLMGLLFVLIVVQSTMALFYFGKGSWRVSFPPILAAGVALAFIGLCNQSLLFFDLLAIVFGYCASVSFSWRLCSKYSSETLSAVSYSCLCLIICGYFVNLSSSPNLHMFGSTLSLVMFVTLILLPFLSFSPDKTSDIQHKLNYSDHQKSLKN